MLNLGRFVFVVLFVGLLLVVPNSVCAKSDPLTLKWNNTYDEYLGALMVQTLDGGFLLAGTNTTLSQQYLQLVKINSVGEVEWSNFYPEISWTPTLIRLADSGYLILHAVNSVGILKVDFQGNIEWSHQQSLTKNTYNSEYVRDVFVVADSGIYVLVIFASSKGGYASEFVCYDVDGVLLWSKRIERVSIDVVLQYNDDDGGGVYYVTGSQDRHLWFAKLDSMGEVVWSRTYGSGFSNTFVAWPRVWSIISLSDGGFLLSGIDHYAFEGLGFVVKLDGEGLVLWSCKFAEPVYDVVEVGGQYLVFSSSRVICLSFSGKMLWDEPYSKYALFENLTNADDVGLRCPVSVFVGDGDAGFVVAVPYGVLGYYTSCLWVAGFTVEPFLGSFSFFYVGLFVVVAVVVVVFIGCLVYLKRGDCLKTRLQNFCSCK